MPPSRNQRATTAERRRKCLELRLGGATWDTIAERLKYSSKSSACKDFDRAMRAAQADTAATVAQHRELELLRLDRLQTGFWMGALNGDPRAGAVIIDIHKARVKLLGLSEAQRTLNNAVDAWIANIGGGGPDDLSPEDAAALDATA